MSRESQERAWSDNPGAPNIPYDLYASEKATWAGIFIGSMLYGMLIVLAFRCMTALMHPSYRRGEAARIRWGLVSYTVLMFSFVTVYTAMNLNAQSTSFIDNRKFPGQDDQSRGPLGYQAFARSKLPNLIPNLMLLLNCWLANGLLLYRCYMIYSMGFRVVVVLPFFLYLGCVVMGVMTLVYQAWGRNDPLTPTVSRFSFLHLSVSVSLNVLLTLMIVIRLVLHNRSIRTATGGPTGISRLCTSIVTILIESSALYAVSSLLVIVLLGAGSHVADTFFPVLAEIQVIAPLLIIQRVADQSALMGNAIVTGYMSSFHVRSRVESISASGVAPGEYLSCPTDEYGMESGGVGVGVGPSIDFYDLRGFAT